MIPEIRTLEPSLVIGLAGCFRPASLSSRPNAAEVIPPLWEALCCRMHEIPHRLNPYCMGVLLPEISESGEKTYVAGAAVSPEALSAPDGMILFEIPAGRYTVFHHHGTIENVAQSFARIVQELLPASGMKVRGDAPWLELYDERFSPDSEDSVFEILAPVE